MPARSIAHFVRRLAAAPLALLAAPLAVFGAAPLHAAEAAPAHAVTISNMSFQGLPAKAAVGDTVIWTNRDMVPHTATAEDGSFDVALPPGASKSIVLAKAGTIKFYCNYHPMMQATLTVVAKAAAPTP